MSDERKGAIPYDDAMAKMYRDNPKLAADVLNACIEEGDHDVLLMTLRQFAKAFGGVSSIAEKAGLNEITLYRTLSRRGNPTLKTLIGITDAMGFRLAFVPKEPKRPEAHI